MSQFPHDEFVKEYIPELCNQYGIAIPSMPISSERREIDVFFQPTKPLISQATKTLGLLGKIIQTTCVLEFYRNAVKPEQIKECLSKLFDNQQNQFKKAKKDNLTLENSQISRLWIITPTISQKILDGFGAKSSDNWESGIYFLQPELRTGIIAVHQLPVNEETFWLRILGKGQTQLKAIEELEKIENTFCREIILELVYKLLENLESNQQKFKKIAKKEEELIMTLRTTFRDKLAETEKRGLQQGLQQGLDDGIKNTLKTNILNILEKRFQSLPPELLTQINQLDNIPQLQKLHLETISVDSVAAFQNLL